MANAESILVIFLASFLALFLLLGCVALYKIIQILNHLKTISEKAEKLAESAEHVGAFFRHAAGPAAVAKFMSGIHEQVFSKSKREKKHAKES